MIPPELAKLSGGPAAPSTRSEVPPELARVAEMTPEPKEGIGGRRTQAVIRGAAEAIDLGTAGFGALVTGFFGESLKRIQGAIEGKPRDQIVKEAAAVSQRIGEQFGTPVETTLENLGILRKGRQGAIGQTMEVVGSKIAEYAEGVEASTQGKVKKEDVTYLVNGLLSALGIKSVGWGTKAVLESAKARRAAEALDAFVAEKAGERAASEVAKPVETPSGRIILDEPAVQPSIRAKTPQEMADQVKAEAKARAARRAEVRAAFAEDPYWADRQRGLAEGMAERREVARAEQARLSNMGEMAARTRPPEQTLTDPQARTLQPNQFGDLVAVEPDALSRATAKVARGRPFDLTAEELAALRVSGSQWNRPQIATAAAVGATGLGLAMAIEPDPEEAALAIGAGVLLAGKGRSPLTLEAIRSMPDAAPHKVFRDASPYTFSTLEMLPENRFEFSKQQIEQLLKRQEVTKLERDVISKALAAAPGETITAKQLWQGVKEATGDFELKKAETREFASHGLGDIGRWPPDEYSRLNPNVPQNVVTRVWRSPIELGDNNHFYDPNYFGHTRSFDEGGIRHVIEVQSDVAQRAGKQLTPEEIAKIEGEVAAFRNAANIWKSVEYEASRAGNYSFWKALERFKNSEQELSKALGHSDETTVFENKLLRNMENGSREAEDIANMFIDEKTRNFSPEMMLEFRRGYVDVSDGFIDWLLKNKNKLSDDDADAMRGVVQRFAKSHADEFDVLVADTEAKLSAAAIDPVRPMLKNWERRLIREEIADAQRAYEVAKDVTLKTDLGPPVIRFADADTVAKVEGWPDLQAAWDQGGRGGMLTATYGRPETRFHRGHQGIYDRYAGEITKFLKSLGAKHVIDAKGYGWWEVPLENNKALPKGVGRTQMGGVDPQLAKSIALIGGGTALGAYLSNGDNPLVDMGIGAVVGLALAAGSRSPAIRDWAQSLGYGAEYVLGEVSTRVGNMSKPLLRRLTSHEMQVLKQGHDLIEATAGFTRELRNNRSAAWAEFERAVLTNDASKIMQLMGKLGNPAILREWPKVRATLDQLGNQLVELGKLKSLRQDYFPRIVVDYEGLLDALGAERATDLQKILEEAERKAVKQTGAGLSPLDRSAIINNYLKRMPAGRGKPGFLKGRELDEVTEKLQSYYAPPHEALPLYIRAAVREIERAKFFGEDLVRSPEGQVDINASIGNVVNRELAAGRIKLSQVEELRRLLNSRFGPGERAMSPALQDIRNLSYAGLLGHPTSAIVQIGDVAVAAFAHGIMPTVKALATVARRAPDRYRVVDLGLLNHISEEFSSTRGSARFLDSVFRYAGFSLVDQFGKATAINAALTKFKAWARSPKGRQRIVEQYGDYFGRDLGKLIEDLQADKHTPLVDELLFRELSDLQPISKIEVPQAYLDNPNARIAYMLKTFMIKQLDVVRRKGIQEMKTNPTRGVANLVKLSVALGLAGASTDFIRDWLLGREPEPEWGDIPINLWKTFGWGEYTIDKIKQGKPIEAVGNLALPPYKMWEQIITADPAAAQSIPIVGRLLYNHYMTDEEGRTGAERAIERRERREEAEQ